MLKGKKYSEIITFELLSKTDNLLGFSLNSVLTYRNRIIINA
jgi:hypothetical protein